MELGRGRNSRTAFIATASIAAAGCLAIIVGSLGKARAGSRVLPPRVPLSTQGLTHRMGLPLWIAPIAERWAVYYSVPVAWVLATIKIESGGNPNLTGDGERSIGLMQVNSVAHADRLRRHGMNRESLFDPNNGVQIGTEILRESLDKIQQALLRYSTLAPLHNLVTLEYQGQRVRTALARGEDPRTMSLRAIRRITRWNNALAQGQALV